MLLEAEALNRDLDRALYRYAYMQEDLEEMRQRMHVIDFSLRQMREGLSEARAQMIMLNDMERRLQILQGQFKRFLTERKYESNES